MKKLLLYPYPTYLLSILIILILIFFHFKGIVYYDEGYILNSAFKIAHGQIAYKDFDMVYTPISFLATALSFHFFGESVFSGRITALLVSLFSIFALYKLITAYTTSKVYAFLSIFFFIAWGPTHINFPWPSMFALCFTLYALLFFQKGLIHKEQKYFFLTGIMTMLVFLSKQNFGIGMLLMFSLSLFFIKSAKHVC